MKITEVDSFLMSYPMPETVRLPFFGGERTIIKRDAMLIRVTTDNGLKGYAPGPAHERACREIADTIRPFLLGKDPRNWRSFGFNADLEIHKTYYAVEVAVIDAAAKYEECPMSDLLGGRKRDNIKLYGSAGMYMEPEGFAEEAAAIANMGFPAYKMRPSQGPEDDLRTVAHMRDAVGPNVELMIDAHSWWRMGDKSYSFDTVAQLAKDMAAYQPYWLEEPLPPDDHDDYQRLTGLRHVTVATGEHEQEESGFMDLIDRRCADFIQMDVCCQGGFEMGRRIFDKCAEANLRFAFHSWGSTLEVLAAAHIGVCWPESVVEWLEYPCYANNGKPGMYPFPISDEILAAPLNINEGHLQMPDAHGLGVEIDERVIEKYPFIPGPWSFFRLDNPPETIAVTGDHSVKWVEPEDDNAE